VLPRTPASAVDALLARLGLDGEQRIRVEPAELPPGVEPVAACGSVRAFVQVHACACAFARVCVCMCAYCMLF